mgnify:CR=1 FL=1
MGGIDGAAGRMFVGDQGGKRLLVSKIQLLQYMDQEGKQMLLWERKEIEMKTLTMKTREKMQDMKTIVTCKEYP